MAGEIELFNYLSAKSDLAHLWTNPRQIRSTPTDCARLIHEINQEINGQFNAINWDDLLTLCFTKNNDIRLTLEQRQLIASLYYTGALMTKPAHVASISEIKDRPKNRVRTGFTDDVDNSPATVMQRRLDFILLSAHTYFLADKDAAYAFTGLLHNHLELPPHVGSSFSAERDGVHILMKLSEVGYLPATFAIADAKGNLSAYPGITVALKEAINLLERTAEGHQSQPEVVAVCRLKTGLIYQSMAEQTKNDPKKQSEWFLQAQLFLEGIRSSQAFYLRGKNIHKKNVSLAQHGQVVQLNNPLYDQKSVNLFEQAIELGDDRDSVAYSFIELGDMVLEHAHSKHHKNPKQAEQFYFASNSVSGLCRIARMYEKGQDCFPLDAGTAIPKDTNKAIALYREAYLTHQPSMQVMTTVVDEIVNAAGKSILPTVSNISTLSSINAKAESVGQYKSSILRLHSTRREQTLTDQTCAADPTNVSSQALKARLRLGQALYHAHAVEENLQLINFAARHQLVSAMYSLALLEFEQARHESAVAWLNEAASHGHPFAHYQLAEFYLNGGNTFLEQDQALALKHMKAAALAPTVTYISIPKENPSSQSYQHVAATLFHTKADTAKKHVYTCEPTFSPVPGLLV